LATECLEHHRCSGAHHDQPPLSECCRLHLAAQAQDCLTTTNLTQGPTMHRFSIIIPLLGDRRLFDDTLASVLRYQPEASQIIVVHDGTYDNPHQIQDEVDLVTSSSGGGLIRCFNSALNEATGETIALLRPGIQLKDGWSLPIQTAFQDPQVASVSPMIVQPGERALMVAAGINKGSGYRRQIIGSKTKIAPRTLRRISPLGPTTWAAFYRRESIAQLGVCGEEMQAHYLDVDLALSLETIGYRCEFCPDCVVEIEEPALITDELVLPHGSSAQRAFRRHGSNESLAQSLLAFAGEIISSPVEPWKFRHAIERLKAQPWETLDRQYAELLSILARQRRHETDKPDRILPLDLPEIGSHRRAA
jgi:cellulose synthase/poly-beta-1,6-N-acetylglucosamine synthase-like glycosyltransferase